MDNSPRQCTPRARCRRWRTCDACAGIRQARIADAAMRLAALAGRLDWATIAPTALGAEALIASRAEFLARHKPPGAIWTVEQSRHTGALHCNVLLPAHEPGRLALASAHVIHGIDRVRQVAAYISKRQQMPDPTHYPGRLYGTAGPLWQYLTSGGVAPPVQAAAIQLDLNAGDTAAPPSIIRALAATASPRLDLPFAEIAARHLPDLMPTAKPGASN